jgi:hypothetical protein
MKTREIQTFGKKTENYSQPMPSAQLKKAKKERNFDVYYKLRWKFSTIMGIFTNKNHLLVDYMKPKTEGQKINSRMLQFYTLEGKFINELQITNEEGCGLYLSKDRDDDILYMLQIVYADNEETDEYFKVTRLNMVN